MDRQAARPGKLAGLNGAGRFSLLHRWIVFVLLLRQVDGGNRVFLFGPGAEIDLFAAVRAKWTEFVFLSPFHLGAASGAVYDCCHYIYLNILKNRKAPVQTALRLQMPWASCHRLAR